MNNRRLLSRRTTFSAIGLVATTLLAGAVFAQADGGGAPPPPGGGGQGGGGGRRGGQRGGRGQQLTVATIPVDTLDAELKLTSDQKTKIAAIQKPVMDMRASMMPKPGAPPVQPDPEMFQTMRTMSTKAESDIKAILTPDQTTALPGVITELTGLQSAGVPAGVVGALALTADEKTSIIDIGSKAQRRMRTAMQDAQGEDRETMMANMKKMQDETKEKVEAVLTPAQKSTLETYIAAHPMPMGGGFGGGGRRGGGGGQGGPPPA